MSAGRTMPAESAARKAIPLARGLLDYFPAALAAVAEVSRAGNEKHNPGEPLHWSRGKSSDHADCVMRHLADRGLVDPEDGLRHSAKVAWRALALLQEELEAAGAPLARGAVLPSEPTPVRVAWSAVPGARGYRVYRTSTQDALKARYPRSKKRRFKRK